MRTLTRLGLLLLLLLAQVPIAPQAGPAVVFAAGENKSLIFMGRPPNPIFGGGYISVPYSPALNPGGGKITIEAWVKRNDVSRCETLVANGWQQSYWLGFCDGKLRFQPHGVE